MAVIAAGQRHTAADATIRIATIEDAEVIQALLEDLARTSRYTGGATLNAPHLATGLVRMLANPDAGFVLAEVDGALIGLLVLLLFEDLISGASGAAEVCWYVRPGFRDGVGVRLLREAETWASGRGATKIQMLSPDERFEALYARRGYLPTTRVWERRLTPCRG